MWCLRRLAKAYQCRRTLLIRVSTLSSTRGPTIRLTPITGRSQRNASCSSVSHSISSWPPGARQLVPRPFLCSWRCTISASPSLRSQSPCTSSASPWGPSFGAQLARSTAAGILSLSEPSACSSSSLLPLPPRTSRPT